jgi:hypothetical protein
MNIGLGHKEHRLASCPPFPGKWQPATYEPLIVKPAVFMRLASLPAKPTVAAIFEAARIFDAWIADWRARKGEYGVHHFYAMIDFDELLTLDTTEREIPGLRWIVDLWEKLGGWLRYTTHPMSRPRDARYHVEPTSEAIEELAEKMNLAPQTDIERAILVLQFERLSLPLRVRLAKIMEV